MQNYKKIIQFVDLSSVLRNTTPTIFERVITYGGERCDLHHFDIDNFDEIPDNLKLKVHAVCMHNGKLLIVNHPEWNIWGIPGGTREDGESIEETLRREIQEESNCEVISLVPISCQKIISPDGKRHHYRLQYFCDVKPLGEFQRDVAGNINKISWIEPDNFEEYIEDKEFKKMPIRRALRIIKKNENRKD